MGVTRAAGKLPASTGTAPASRNPTIAPRFGDLLSRHTADVVERRHWLRAETTEAIAKGSAPNITISEVVAQHGRSYRCKILPQPPLHTLQEMVERAFIIHDRDLGPKRYSESGVYAYERHGHTGIFACTQAAT